MEFTWLTPVRGVQLLFALIVLAIDGNLLATIGSYSQLNYIIFVTLYTLLITIYILFITHFRPDTNLSNPLPTLVMDALSWIYWLAAWACIAAVDHCGGASEGLCGRFNALLAFGVLEWILFSITAGYNAYLMYSARRNGTNTNTGTSTSTYSGFGFSGLNFGKRSGGGNSKVVANEYAAPPGQAV